MRDDFCYVLGSNIRAERLRRHYTQDELAELLDMSVNYVGKIERGSIIPSALVIFKLANILRVDINEFFKEINYKS